MESINNSIKSKLIQHCLDNSVMLFIMYDTENSGRGCENLNFSYTNHKDSFLSDSKKILCEQDFNKLVNEGIVRVVMDDRINCFCLGKKSV